MRQRWALWMAPITGLICLVWWSVQIGGGPWDWWPGGQGGVAIAVAACIAAVSLWFARSLPAAPTPDVWDEPSDAGAPLRLTGCPSESAPAWIRQPGVVWLVAADGLSQALVLEWSGDRPLWWVGADPPSRSDDRALDAWVDANPGGLLVVDPHKLGGYLPFERDESRLLRLVAAVGERARAGGVTVVLRTALAAERLVLPDAAGRALRVKVDRALCWTTDGAVVPAAGSGGMAEWLVSRDGAARLTVQGQLWERRMWGVAAVMACTVGVALQLVPALVGRWQGTPLLGDAGAALPGSLWLNWWVLRWFTDAGQVLHSDLIHWPVGADVAGIFGNGLAAAIAAPFQYAFGYPGYWNVFVAAALVSAGVAAWALARAAGGGRAGSALAAVAFSCSGPLLAEVAVGQSSVLWAFPLPLALAAGLRALDSDAPRAGWLAGLALCVASVGWWFYGLMAVAVLGWAAGVRWWRFPQRRPVLQAQGGRILRAMLPALLAAGPVLEVANRGDLIGLRWGALPHQTEGRMLDDLLLGSTLSASAGLPAGAAGLGMLAVAVVALYWGLGPGRRRWAWPWVAGVAWVLAIGPYAQLPGGDWVVLPLAWMQGWLPLMSRLLAPERLLLLTALAGAVLVAVSAAPVSRRVPRSLQAPLFGAAMVSLAVVPGWLRADPLPVTDFEVPAWTALLADDGAVLQVPIGWSEVSAMSQPLTGRPTVGGPGVAWALSGFSDLRKELETNGALSWFWNPQRSALDPAALGQLRAQGLRYIVVDMVQLQAVMGGRPDARTQGLPMIVQRVDRTLGPPIYATPDVRVYALPQRIELAGGGSVDLGEG